MPSSMKLTALQPKGKPMKTKARAAVQRRPAAGRSLLRKRDVHATPAACTDATLSPRSTYRTKGEAIQALEWKAFAGYEEATIGEFYLGDGVRFSLTHHLTYYRRGQWCLLVEVADGPMHEAWGCFDDQDQPTRNFHKRENALSEAQALADVLLVDRRKRERSCR